MTTLLIVQARMTSTRLPGKVLLPLAGAPMFTRLVQRLRRVRRADGIVIATTTNATDHPIAALCDTLGVPCHRGSEHDVLSRYADATRLHGADVVVRITADCPLIDAALIDEVIAVYAEGGSDYVSNMLPPTWPYGMAVEVFSAAALQQAHAEATQAAEREHVTPFIYWHPDRYRLRNVESPVDLSHHRWTVDTPEDYELVRRLFETLHPINPEFTLADILTLLDTHPDWMTLNQHVEQKPATESQTKEPTP
ncbi:cytidylyltransferase domain-containing protein [Rhodoferax ferrireducens]|uniref:cytidylyltransferase domain-containing protein n=1 Tax=Rhodoferax ferrireducens TaxID=192843 RepID=UPI000E0DF96C|nr:glycosyltransferase family protein [Rhodoferax ferrireducens]